MPLPKFGKKKVTKAAMIIRKTGDGFSEVLKFAPIALDHGEEVYLVVRGVVVDVQHPSEDRKDPASSDLRRVHIVDAIEATLVTYAEVEPMLKAADDRLAEFRLAESLEEERAAGIQRLTLAEPPDAADG